MSADKKKKYNRTDLTKKTPDPLSVTIPKLNKRELLRPQLEELPLITKCDGALIHHKWRHKPKTTSAPYTPAPRVGSSGGSFGVGRCPSSWLFWFLSWLPRRSGAPPVFRAGFFRGFGGRGGRPRPGGLFFIFRSALVVGPLRGGSNYCS